jgi:hypothetical protein
MITKLLYASILLVGVTFTVNGAVVNANDMIADAFLAAGSANISQFRTALDLYYIDHGKYPEVYGGANMIDILKSENYIRENGPLNVDNFDYQVEDNGQDYLLELK